MARLTKAAQAAAEAQAADDAALLAALQERDIDVDLPEVKVPEAPAQQTIGDQFLDIIEVLAKAKRQSKLSEATIIRAWELNLTWIFQNRQLGLQEAAQRPSFPYPTGSGDEDGDGEDVPRPINEVIGDEPTAEEQT